MNRDTVVNIMKSWIGKSKSNGSHKDIIDIYNSISPRPVGYKVTYSDNWCAATVSAAYHKAGYDSIFPFECSCSRMIEKAKKMGIWVEDDGYIPQPADCLIYDWQDNGIGDNVGAPDHVGLVEKVTNKQITVIEGNKGNSSVVGRRVIKINGKNIRGYVAPKFGYTTTENVKTNEQIAKEVYQGKWGNGVQRRIRLKEAGYDPDEIQKLVNRMVI